MRVWEVGGFRLGASWRGVSCSIPGLPVTVVGVVGGILVLCAVALALARRDLERNVALLLFTLYELFNNIGSLVGLLSIGQYIVFERYIV